MRMAYELEKQLLEVDRNNKQWPVRENVFFGNTRKQIHKISHHLRAQQDKVCI